MITLSIAGNTPAEVAERVAGFYQQLRLSAGTSAVEQQSAPSPESTPLEGEILPPEKKADKAPKTRKAAEAKAETKDEPKAESKQVDLEEAIAEKTAAPTLEETRAALMKLSKVKGDDEVWNLLEKYKAKSASTIAEADRAKVVAEIEELCK